MKKGLSILLVMGMLLTLTAIPSFAKYLDKDIVEKLADKVQHGEIVEYLDI